MPTLKTRFRLWFAQHSRLLSGLQFAVLVLVISAASGLAAASLIRILYVEQLTELKSQYTNELKRMTDINRERLEEKDQTIAKKDKLLTDLAGRLGVIATKTERAAETVKSAVDKVTQEPEPPSKPKRIEQPFIEP